MQTQTLLEHHVAVGAPPYAVLAIAAPLADLDALVRILRDLPGGFRLPIVVALLGPERTGESTADLPSRLQPHTALAVRWLGHRVPLRPGTVSLCMPGESMVVASDGVAQRLPATAAGPMRSARTLLGSIADSHAERALALVLGGAGADDRCGLRRMKAKGATLLALEEAAAQAWGSARKALDAGAFDLVLPLGRIVSTLLRIAAATRRTGTTGVQRAVSAAMFSRDRGTPHEVAAVRRAMQRVIGALEEMCMPLSSTTGLRPLAAGLGAQLDDELGPIVAQAGRSLTIDCAPTLAGFTVANDLVRELAQQLLANVLAASTGDVEVRVTELRLFLQIVVKGERPVADLDPRSSCGGANLRALHAFVKPLRGNVVATQRAGRVEYAVWLPRIGAPHC